MRLADDTLAALHDLYLDHAEGEHWARTCRRLHRLLRGRSLIHTPQHPKNWSSVADESVVWRFAVRSKGETPRRFPLPSRYTGLRRFEWTAKAEGHDAIAAVLRAAADLPLLEDLVVSLVHCGLTDATVDGVVAQPIRVVRRAVRRLRRLAVNLSDNRMGPVGVACVVAAVVFSPGADGDRLEDLTLGFGDTTGDAVAALAPIGEMTGLRRLTVRVGGATASPESVRCGLVDGAMRANLRCLCLTVHVDDRYAVRGLFAAAGRCRALRCLDVELRCRRFVDRELVDDVFAPLTVSALTHLTLDTENTALETACVDPLAVLVRRLRSFKLSGPTFEPEALFTGLARIVADAPALYRFELFTRHRGSHPPPIDAPPPAVPRWPVGLGVLRLAVLGYPPLTGCSFLETLLDSLRLHASAGGRLTELEFRVHPADLSDAHRNVLCATVGAMGSLRGLAVATGCINTCIAAPEISKRLRQMLPGGSSRRMP